MVFALWSVRYWIVGSAARMRVSSLTVPFSNGTLKSTRTRTRLPKTSRSRTVFLFIAVFSVGRGRESFCSSELVLISLPKGGCIRAVFLLAVRLPPDAGRPPLAALRHLVGQHGPALDLAGDLATDEYHVLTGVNELTRFSPVDCESEFLIHRRNLRQDQRRHPPTHRQSPGGLFSRGQGQDHRAGPPVAQGPRGAP